MLNFFSFLKSSPELGYLIVLLGAMIEGETIILGASALAAIGYLSITKVSIIAFLGTLFVDQALYLVGYRMYKKPGAHISERFPRLYKKSQKAVALLKKYDIGFILTFRFIYGIRAISPVVIALCGSRPSRFIPLNFVSAVIWTVISCSIGYWLGDFLFDAESGVIVSHNLHKVQFSVLICIAIIIALIFVYKFVKKNLK
ncbi:MAG: DedA family protein [Holosporales bacterium]|nr:DedA family protein [Holosporales bacterium]